MNSNDLVSRLIRAERKLIELGADPDYVELVLPKFADRIATVDPEHVAGEIFATVPAKWKSGKRAAAGGAAETDETDKTDELPKSTAVDAMLERNRAAANAGNALRPARSGN